MSDSTPAPSRLAVFDYDGTIVSGQSGLLIARYMFSLKLMKKRHGARLFWWGIRYLMHLPHREAEARELVFKSLIGQDPEAVESFMSDFHDEVLAPLYRNKAEREIAARKAEGCTVLLASATFSMLADIAAERLGMDGSIATLMELDGDGLYTGKVEGDVIEGKAKLAAIRSWADERFGEGGWELAYAYVDHHSDKPLLGAAKQAFAVCPKKSFGRYARKQGWEILGWSE